MDDYDFAVIGAGPGGYVAAIRAAQLGMKTALIEKRRTLGGTCLNVGCIPSKALLESSELFHAAAHRLEAHGIGLPAPKLDLERMMARKNGIVKEVTDGLKILMKKNKITVLKGRGLLGGGGTIRVRKKDGDTMIQAKHIVLAMGSVPIELPGLPFDGTHIVSSTEALAFKEVPKRLIVVGAGAIGLELGSVWNRLGAKVTVVELLPRIAFFADQQAGKALERALSAQGLAFMLNSKVIGAKIGKATVSVDVAGEGDKTSTLECDKLLVCVGRKPCTDTADIGKAGVELDGKGRVRVDDRWRTTAPGIYAVGDLIHGPMLAHKAEDEGVAVAELAAGLPGHVNYGAVPNVIYTWPELAQVGLTEEELKEKGIPYKVGRNYFKANARAKSLGEDEGFVKVLSHKETDRLLGVHIMGARASDMIAEAVMAMEFQGSAEDVARTCHAHPTLSEIFKEAALAVDRRALHG